MKILGIDLGRSKVGLAIAESPLAQPYRVIKVVSPRDAADKIVGEADKLGVEEIVVGISEGEMGREQQNFSLLLKSKTSLPVKTWDETLTTQDAQLNALKAGIGRKRRADMEDAFAAAVMIQSYLDSQDR